MKIDLKTPYKVKKVEKIDNNNINFSIIIITRNNGNHLQELLDSLTEFKDKGGDILIFDIESSDNTLEIAENWGCRVEHGDNFFRTIDEDMSEVINEKFKRDDINIVDPNDTYIDFAGARDYSSSLVDNDMILMLDGNSRIVNLDIDEINISINNGFDYFDFTIHNKNNNIFGFYNKRKYKWNNLINEKLSLYEDNPQTGTLPDNILALESLEQRKKDEYYVNALIIESFLNNEFLNELIDILSERKLHNSVLNLYEIKTSDEDTKPHIKSKNFVNIGDSLLETGRHEEAIEHYHKAFITYSKWRTPLFRLANHFFLNSEWDKAIFYAQGCLNIKRPEVDLEEKDFYYEDGPYSILYVSCWWEGDIEKGKYYFDKALELNPKNELYLSESKYHYEYEGNIIDGELSFKDLQFLYNTSKKYKSILEIGAEQGRSTHAIISSNENIITVLNNNIDKESMINNLNNPGNIRFVDDDDISDEKFELIIMNCGNISKCALKGIINKYQFKSTKMLMGYNYNSNKKMINELLEIDGVYDNIWYKKISNFEKRTVYIRKEEKINTEI